MAHKPGVRSSEFWLTAAVQAVGGALEYVALHGGGVAPLVAGAALQALSLFGYTWSRTRVKAIASAHTMG